MTLLKKSLRLSGHETSVKLEEEFWIILSIIAEERNKTLREFVEYEDSHRKERNLASHLRVLALHFVASKQFRSMLVKDQDQEKFPNPS